MQKTTFSFIALVHDDASTDDTAEIVRDYANCYPNIIVPILDPVNRYSMPGSLNFVVGEVTRAYAPKYIALCEGDDYWTDPLKLQKQVDFLEEHQDYAICFHNVKVLDDNTGEIKKDWITRDVQETTDINRLAIDNYIHTLSVVYRNISLTDEEKNLIYNIFPGDYPRHLIMAQYGQIFKISDAMGVYRCSSGIWSSKNSEYRISLTLDMLRRLIDFFIPNDSVVNILKKTYSRLTSELYVILETQNCNERIFERMRVDFRYSKKIFLIRHLGKIEFHHFQQTCVFKAFIMLLRPLHRLKKMIK